AALPIYRGHGAAGGRGITETGAGGGADTEDADAGVLACQHVACGSSVGRGELVAAFLEHAQCDACDEVAEQRCAAVTFPSPRVRDDLDVASAAQEVEDGGGDC